MHRSCYSSCQNRNLLCMFEMLLLLLCSGDVKACVSHSNASSKALPVALGSCKLTSCEASSLGFTFCFEHVCVPHLMPHEKTHQISGIPCLDWRHRSSFLLASLPPFLAGLERWGLQLLLGGAAFWPGSLWHSSCLEWPHVSLDECPLQVCLQLHHLPSDFNTCPA